MEDKAGYNKARLFAGTSNGLVGETQGFIAEIYPPAAVKGRYVVRFYPPLGHEQETGGHLNARLALLPTIPHPDLSDVLEHGGNGDRPAMRLELARYQGKLADILEIDGSVTAEKAAELEHIIETHLPPDAHQLGVYLSGLEKRRSCPLALTQLLIAYQMVSAGEAVQI